MADPSSVLRNALSDPHRLLGLVERNVEAKLVGPVLELLGWDPAEGILWGPQVQRHGERGRRDVEADAFVADIAQGRLRFIVEAKRWERPLDARAINQTLGYLHDVGARRALLTNGRRWLVIDAGEHKPILAHSIRSGDVDPSIAALVAALMPYLSPATAPTTPLPPIRAVTPASADIDQLASDDPLIGELVLGIRALADDNPERIYVDTGPMGMLVRTHRTGRVILPVNAADPLKPDLYAHELETLGVDANVRAQYTVALRRLSAERTSEAVTAYLAALGAVVTALP